MISSDENKVQVNKVLLYFMIMNEELNFGEKAQSFLRNLIIDTASLS